ncbi:MAG: hemerythrin domain-containing protein [Caulobacteraceae bacterium]|nr:hemerythrin domain-containing protein [Caulobacteraceae bacterium]
MPDAPLHADHLFARTRLPDEFRWLESGCPRQAWSEPDRIHAMGAHWLEIHGWFRQMLGGLTALTGQWREGGLAAPQYQALLMPRLQQFLQNLDGHHQRESRLYFPAFSRQEPRIAAGIALLDRDHEVVHGLLERMFQTGNDFNRALAGGADTAGPGAALADAIEAASMPLARHLHDEEDIVVPLLTLHGDPFENRHE